MKRQLQILILTAAASLVSTGCAQDDTYIREKGHRVRVRAPFTSVDVFVPDDDGHETDVDVDVDD